MVIMFVQLNIVLLGKSLSELQSAHHACTNVFSVFILIIHIVPTEATLSLFSSLLAFRINDEFNKISTYLASRGCLFVSNCDHCGGSQQRHSFLEQKNQERMVLCNFHCQQTKGGDAMGDLETMSRKHVYHTVCVCVYTYVCVQKGPRGQNM